MASAVPLHTVRLRRLLGRRIVFISYRRSDSGDITGRIYDRLVNAYGRSQVIRDVNSIPAGVDYRDYIERVVPLCHIVLTVIGPGWIKTNPDGSSSLSDPEDLVRTELLKALEHGIRVIPLLVNGGAMPAKEALPMELRRIVNRHALSVRCDPDFHWDVDRLMAQL